MKPTVATCLWFKSGAKEAADFYCSLIPDSALGPVMNGPDGNPLMVELTIGGAPFQLLNGGPHYDQTPAASIVVRTEGQEETDRIWNALIADGGKESRCAWCVDRFGVSWQVVPRELGRYLGDDDREAAGRAMQAMLKMNKIVIKDLEAAFRGES